jgi:hypothetical protein
MSAKLGNSMSASPAEVRRALGELKIGKTILVHPLSGEIWMAGPFAAARTPYEVRNQRHSWWANCAWDMFGVAMIVGERSEVRARCGDCGEPLTVVADPVAEPEDVDVVHFLLPARRWYDDIGFT